MLTRVLALQTPGPDVGRITSWSCVWDGSRRTRTRRGDHGNETTIERSIMEPSCALS